jgi:hypothetical protein
MIFMMMPRPASKASYFRVKDVKVEELLQPSESQSSIHSWCLPVLRTEAQLRLSSDYINSTRQYFDRGEPSPESLDQEVEVKALEKNGYTAEHLGLYRNAARLLSHEEREEIFFLRANDRLFRPFVQLEGKSFEGSVYQVSSMTPVSTTFEDIFMATPKAVLVASTSS